MGFKSAFDKHVLVSYNMKSLRWHTSPKFRYLTKHYLESIQRKLPVSCSVLGAATTTTQQGVCCSAHLNSSDGKNEVFVGIDSG